MKPKYYYLIGFICLLGFLTLTFYPSVNPQPGEYYLHVKVQENPFIPNDTIYARIIACKRNYVKSEWAYSLAPQTVINISQVDFFKIFELMDSTEGANVFKRARDRERKEKMIWKDMEDSFKAQESAVLKIILEQQANRYKKELVK